MHSRPPDPSTVRRLASERGSMLITAMGFAFAIAMVLSGYLALSRTTLKVTHRTFFANDAANLAEAGLEEALYCFNLMAAGTAPATAWSGWTISSTNAMRALPTFNRDQNAVGIVKVYVKGYDGSDEAPYVVSQAIVTPFDGGAPVIRTVHLVIRRNAMHGLVALNGLTMNNTTIADSYVSNPTNSPTGPWQVYPAAGVRFNASVVVLAGSCSIVNGQIRGKLYLGPGVAPPLATEVTGTITTNYSATFPFPTYPTAAGVSQSYNLASTIPATLPRVGDLPAADGRFYYFCNNTSIRSFSVTAGKNVTIVGTPTVGMPISSLTLINLPTTSTLYVYMTGAFTVTGGADLNAAGYAGALRIYTSTASNCTIADGSQIVIWFHAPNAALSAVGSTASNRLSGYFIAKTITVSNAQNLHFDESLTSYDVTRWMDFQSAADRATVAGLTGSYLK